MSRLDLDAHRVALSLHVLRRSAGMLAAGLASGWLLSRAIFAGDPGLVVCGAVLATGVFTATSPLPRVRDYREGA